MTFEGGMTFGMTFEGGGMTFGMTFEGGGMTFGVTFEASHSLCCFELTSPF